MAKRLKNFDKKARQPKNGSFANYEDRFANDATFRARMLEHGFGPDFRYLVEHVYSKTKGKAYGKGSKGKNNSGERQRSAKGPYDQQGKKGASSSSSSWENPATGTWAGGWAAATTWASSWSTADGASNEIVIYEDKALVAQGSFPSDPGNVMAFIFTPYFLIAIMMLIAILFFVKWLCGNSRIQRVIIGNSTVHRWVKLLRHAWRLRFRLSLWAFLGQHFQDLDPFFSHHLRSVYLPPSGVAPKISRRMKNLRNQAEGDFQQ